MKLKCARCAADFTLDKDEPFLTCPYCDSHLFLDRTQTHQHYIIPPTIPASRAVVAAMTDAGRKGYPFPKTGVKPEGVLLPFWGIRGKEMQETLPAFTPCPFALSGYRLPAAEAAWYNPDGVAGFETIEPSETSSLDWQDHPKVSSFSLYSVPFHRIRYGKIDPPYELFIDAVSGRIFWGQTPPSGTDDSSRRFTWLLFGLLGAASVTAAVLPGFLPALIGVGVLGALAFPLFRSALRPEGAP
jgi:DNA-directed RNA polymerase subunit RPC12/RpoP